MKFKPKKSTPGAFAPWSRPWLIQQCLHGVCDGFIRIDRDRVTFVMQKPDAPKSREELEAIIYLRYGVRPLEIYLHQSKGVN